MPKAALSSPGDIGHSWCDHHDVRRAALTTDHTNAGTIIKGGSDHCSVMRPLTGESRSVTLPPNSQHSTQLNNCGFQTVRVTPAHR